MKPAVLIFRELLLPGSETFILNQGEMLSRYTPVYFGSRRVSGLELPPERARVASTGRFGALQEARLRVLGDAGRSAQWLRSVAPSLVHAHFGPDAVTAARMSRRLGLPLVVTYHGIDVTLADEVAEQGSYSQRRFVKRRGRVFDSGVLHIAVSHFIERRLLDLGCPAEKLAVHYIGVDTQRFVPPASATRNPVVLFVGRLVEKKGCGDLLEAMRIVQDQIDEAEVIVIGDGPLRAALEESAAQLKRVRFLGAQPGAEVAAWMRRAKAFCVPSVTAANGDAEGFGLVFTEAQACGLPVVSYASGGIAEAVQDGVTGLLCRERDISALAANLLTMLRDEPLRRRMGEAGRARVRREFDLASQTAQLEILYDQALSSHGVKLREGLR